MRIVAGTASGIILESPEGSDIRPTSDRVREAIFNALFSMGGPDGWQVVDLFAGTGALGIEALSRGAAHCTFVERSAPARELIEINLERTGFSDHATILNADAATWRGSADLILADPPYGFDGWAGLLAGLDAELLILESEKPIELGAQWANVRQKAYSSTVTTFARRASSQSPGDTG